MRDCTRLTVRTPDCHCLSFPATPPVGRQWRAYNDANAVMQSPSHPQCIPSNRANSGSRRGKSRCVPSKRLRFLYQPQEQGISVRTLIPKREHNGGSAYKLRRPTRRDTGVIERPFNDTWIQVDLPGNSGKRHKHTKLHIIKLSKLTSRLYASLIRKLKPTCRQLRATILRQLLVKKASEQVAQSASMRS